METLSELIQEIERLGESEAIRFHNGFRTWTLSYRSLHQGIAGFVRFLDGEGIVKGDRLLLWGENRPEWIISFWASVARGIEIVPIDFRSSARFVARVQERVQARSLVHGSSAGTETLPPRLQRIPFERITGMQADGFEPAAMSREDVVEIVFTSGTTGDPKGVVHRHRHLCANLTPIQREIDRYKRLARPLQPIRILDLLPLSHLFGQSLGLFIPVLLEGAAVFTSELHPGAIVRTAKRERVSVMVSVPQLLRNLRHEVERRTPSARNPRPTRGFIGALRAWWEYRDMHRAFGWRFWALVVGGARLPTEEEEFWRRLGFVVVQGYGLTETSPAVTINHPFRTRPGSLGRIVGDLEVEIAPDGEILVRGESVVSEYLGGSPRSSTFVDSEGWLHTGDLGRIDEEKNLYFLGRKKDLIVTPEGLNVYPQDIESQLNRLPEVAESVVVDLPRHGREEVHAVLRLEDPAADVEGLIRRANESLEPHQRIRGWTVWPEGVFPRTESTLKIKRQEILARLREPATGTGARWEASSGVAGILAEMTGRRASDLSGPVRLSEDLGLSSLEQVDLLSRLEERYGVPLEEASLTESETLAALEERIRQAQSAPGTAKTRSRPHGFAVETIPRWSRSVPARWARSAVQQAVFWPLLHHYIDLTVEGVDHLADESPPVIFAANHESHLDTPFIIAALPRRWRHWIAPAAQQAHFRSFLEPSGALWQRAGAGFQYLLACALFNIYPLPRDAPAVRRALRFTGELVDQGYCPLVFPEGERSPDGRMLPFQPGIGLMAVRLRMAVIPIYLKGMYEIFSLHDRWPRRGRALIRIGTPLVFGEQDDYWAAANRIRQSIVDLREHGT